MKPIEFPEQNAVFAKDQPEYLPLPAYKVVGDNRGLVISCWQLKWWERIKLLFTGRLWIRQLTFDNPLQPQLPEVDRPFLNGLEWFGASFDDCRQRNIFNKKAANRDLEKEREALEK